MLEAVNGTGTVLTTSLATLAPTAMTTNTNLTASASAAPAARLAGGGQGAAATAAAHGLSKAAIWGIVGGAVAAGSVAAVVVTKQDASPTN
jgi:hypothetical protein